MSGHASSAGFVPGATEYGPKGLWFKYKNDNDEYSQACAVFFRNEGNSSTKTVQVLLNYAIDTPVLAPDQIG